MIEPELADTDALPEAESAAEIAGMGKHIVQRKEKGHGRLPDQPKRQPGSSRR